MLRLLLSALQDAQALLATGELRSISGAKQSRVLKQGHPASYPPFAVFYQKHIALVQQRCLAEGLGCGGRALAKMAGTMWSELSEAEKQPFVQEAARRGAENAAKLDAGEQARNPPVHYAVPPTSPIAHQSIMLCCPSAHHIWVPCSPLLTICMLSSHFHGMQVPARRQRAGITTATSRLATSSAPAGTRHDLQGHMS